MNDHGSLAERGASGASSHSCREWREGLGRVVIVENKAPKKHMASPSSLSLPVNT